MNQEIKILGELIITFTWMDDKLVYVKYFKNGVNIPVFYHLSFADQATIEQAMTDFKNEHSNLIMWSYLFTTKS